MKAMGLMMFNKLSQLLPNPIISGIFIVATVLFFYQGSPLMLDPDVPWHLEAGKDILELKALPETAHDSFTAGDYKWFNIAWSWDILVAYIDIHYGLQYVYILQVFLGALIVTLTTFLAFLFSA